MSEKVIKSIKKRSEINSKSRPVLLLVASGLMGLSMIFQMLSSSDLNGAPLTCLACVMFLIAYYDHHQSRVNHTLLEKIEALETKLEEK